MSPRRSRGLVPTPVGRVPGLRDPIVGLHLVLEPAPREQVLAFLAADFSTVRPGSGWPVPETTPGSPPWRISITYDVEVNWLVVLHGLVIGDCFTTEAPTRRATSRSATPWRSPTDGAGTEPRW